MNMLEHLFKDVPHGFINIWDGRTKASSWFGITELDLAITRAEVVCAEGHDAYYSCCPQKMVPETGRGKGDAVECVPFLWAEIDVYDTLAHARNDYPPDGEAVKAVLTEFGADPTWLVFSGHGYHAYWKLDEPLPPDEGKAAVKALQDRLRDLFQQRGWTMDNTADLARVLRVPGTTNFKAEPISVEVKLHTGKEYSFDDLINVIRAEAAHQEPECDVPLSPGTTSGRRVVANCPFFQRIYKARQYVPEQEWFAFLTNLAQCEDGQAIVTEVHKFCRPAAKKYTWEETLTKFLRAQSERKPITCAVIGEELHAKECQGCPHLDIAAPVALGSPKYEYLDAMERITRNISPDPYGDLAVVKLQNPQMYKDAADLIAASTGETKSVIQSKVKERAKARASATLAMSDVRRLDETYPDFPVPELNAPNGWDISDAGVKKLVLNAAGIPTRIAVACPVPVGISARYRDIESKEEQIELSWYCDDRWHKLVSPRSMVFAKQKVISLTDAGLPLTSERARDFVNYIAEFEDANRHILKIKTSMRRYGWCGEKAFAPYGAPDIRLDMDDSANGCRTKGTLDGWLEVVHPLYTRFESRFMMSASFTAPFLKPLRLRTMVIHLWGGSGKGKTAVLRAAVSAWGNPDFMQVTFNTTHTGIERHATRFCDVPIGIDEKQMGNTKNNFMETMIYIVSAGVSKLRGNKYGGTDPISHWRTIALTNGEHPLTEDTTYGGVKTRSIEIRFPGLDDDDSHSIYQGVMEHHGWAASEFVKRVLAMDMAEAKRRHERYVAYLLEKGGDKSRSHVDLIAAVALGDYYSRLWLHGIDDAVADTEAKLLAKWALDKMESNEDRDDTLRAYEMLRGWVAGNSERFNASSSYMGESYGLIDRDYLYILPYQFNKIMTEWGFSPRRVLSDLNEKGYVWGEKGKLQRRVNINRNRIWCYAIRFEEAIEEEHIQEDDTCQDS